jgi:NADH:ubiquinone oxidoreductase subunit B-like Fe-S oxidoreductase
VPVDLHIAGCPPSPIALLEGLLALLETAAGEAPRDARAS